MTYVIGAVDGPGQGERRPPRSVTALDVGADEPERVGSRDLSPPRSGPIPGWPKRLVAVAAVCSMAGGLITLLGWVADIQRLTDWRNDGISMFPNTAACAVASGLALLLHGLLGRRSRVATACLGALVALIGGLTLVEHLSGIDLGIDVVLMNRPWGQGAASAPMRMGPPASISFLVTGIALVLLTRDGRARGVGAASGMAVIVVAMLSLTGYLYGAEQMYTIPGLTGIAMQTASMLLALGIGLVASVPDREPMRRILERSAAGILVRRALPVVIVLAIALGFLRVLIQNHGLVDTALGTALRTLVEIVLLTALLWWASSRVCAHEQALRERGAEVRLQAAQLAAFVDTAAIGMHRVSSDGIILWVNDAELTTLGYAREEYVGHHIGEFHADHEALASILGRLRRGEKLFDHPARMRCKDGTVKSVLVDSSLLWDDEGRIVHTQCFTRDVTERQNAERVRSLLAAIIEASDDAVVSITLDGTITSWNAAAERIFGYTAAEAVRRSIDLIIPPDRLDEEGTILAKLRRGERIDHSETVRRAKDGRLVDISLTLSPVRDASGAVVGASKIARDITDRKRAETEREETNRRKDEFIAILAHELRNPLAPVRNAARYLKLRDSADPDVRRQVDVIERQVAQMSRLIDDLLDVSRISRGTLDLRRERVACTAIVGAAVDDCRDELLAKGHQLRVNMPGEPVEIEADRERLGQVLYNLIGNAAKYTHPSGRIEITVTTAPPCTLVISVKDDGIGIPPAKLTEIFDLFARVDHSLDRQGGLGIGLTLVRQLAELHGGTIEARSEGIGHGSEFVLRLPVIVTTAAAEAALTEPGPACTPLRILVAEDNPDAAESLMLLLQLGGHEVHVVFDGEAAVTAAEEVAPDVALLDIGMPQANGYEVARRIRDHARGKQIYLVALTGWGQDGDRRRAAEAGFDAHLVKPVPPEALDRLLATVSVSRGAPDVATERHARRSGGAG
jgi:PAS domain S-box-containing protein